MNGYPYNGGYDGSNMGQSTQNNGGGMVMMGQSGVDGNMVGGQSLNEIVNQNAKAIRRQSMPHPYSGAPDSGDSDARRMSMMEYNGGPRGDMAGFQYDTTPRMDQRGMTSGHGPPPQPQYQHPSNRVHARNDLSVNTSFPNLTQDYNTMMHNSAYSASAQPHTGYSMTMESPYMEEPMGMQMDYTFDPSLNAERSNLNIYSQPQFSQGMVSSPMHPSVSQNTPHSAQPPLQDPSGGGSYQQYSNRGNTSGTSTRQPSRSHSLHIPQASSPTDSGGGQTPTSQQHPPTPGNQHGRHGFDGEPQHPQPGSGQDRGLGSAASMYDGVNGPVPVDASNYNPNNQGFKWEVPEGGWPSTMVGKPHMQTTNKNTYSSTGFDMLGVLMRVAARPNPEISIGSVDLSCAFVVCDAEKDDFPIVYCSDNFERLTGYTKHMILGRNCRFLQSPDGNVEPGIRRKYVDDDSVLYLKNMVSLRREAQISLINYRRGGQPFMNLLTMIPISWDTDQVKYFVGFQVDLVEQPNAVTNKNADGSYSINYQRGMTMPRYILNTPDHSQKTDLGQTVPRDDVSAILSTIGGGESEYAKRMWDKVLLENTDDVVHVLSLKGLFQWVSPSAARILEYEPGEIIGTALSSVCHPSDIVPVTRELKDTSSGASVNIVFRIRRKNSGYMWFEGHGSLHTEQGKGRKSIILVGRERPVYALSKTDITNAGGIGENELWTKMSTSGMFLFVSANVRQLLDRQPDDLVGVSIQSLMRADSKSQFGRILELARTGKKASLKHEMINRRGQVLSAYTTLYPGDATEGLKPTFILAQTRLIKFTRAVLPNRPPLYPKQERMSVDSAQSSAPSLQQVSTQDTTEGERSPVSPSPNKYANTDGAAATYGGHNGLMIGHQDDSLASEDNLFDELKTTKSSSWQYEIRQLEKRNRILAEEVQALTAAKKKRKRRRGKDQQKDCANCHTRVTPEWRRGPSGQRDLCNSCGLRWAKLNGRVSPRTSSQHSVHSGGASDRGSKASASPLHQSQPAIKTESPVNNQTPFTTAATPGVEPQESPIPTRLSEGHASQMEGASGIPDKIDEGIEPQE